MNSKQCLYKLCSKRQQIRHKLVTNWTQNRYLFGFGNKKTKTEESVVERPTETDVKTGLTAEEVMAMRDKSRLPPEVRSRYTLKDIPEIKTLKHMRTDVIRKRYATYGQSSGLKPGVMWPTKEELAYIKGYEKTFCKPLSQMLDELKAAKEQEMESRREREREVMSRLKDLPKFKAEFWQKYRRMREEVSEESAKKERLVQEVREFVGYDLDPNDPRFDEALLKKDEEQKKIMKTQKKLEKQRQTLERLQALANEAMDREREEKEISDKSKVQTKSND